MKKFFLTILLSFSCHLCSTIIQTSEIEQIKQEMTNDSLVFFNIAEVLMDSKISLGTQAWRKFVRKRVDAQLHDALTLFVFEKIPPKTPEKDLPQLIGQLQKEGIALLPLLHEEERSGTQVKCLASIFSLRCN